MYNRYIPQPDGSYQRNRMPDKVPGPPPKPPVQEFPPECDEPAAPVYGPPRPSPAGGNILGFFRQLLPKDLDTGDILILLLLLLMAGDCEESRNNALLTIALYFFL